MKNAIKREQSQACLSYAEREHFGASLNKTYMKPEMKAVYFHHQPQLIVTSAQGEDMTWDPNGIEGDDR